MNPTIRRRWQPLVIAFLAMLMLVQSVATVWADAVAVANQQAATSAADGDGMPCDNGGDGSCCDDDMPADPSCQQMPDCAGGDCGLRAATGLALLSTLAPAALRGNADLPAGKRSGVFLRHDSPLIRPPISA